MKNELTQDPLVKLSDALPLLGNVNRNTALRWFRRGQLPLVMVGGLYFIRASALIKISEGRISECLDTAQCAAATNQPAL